MNPELIILQSLQSVYPRGLHHDVLNADMRVSGRNISLTDQDRHCRNLEAKGQVTVITAQDYTFIKITPDGLARLAE